MKPNNSFAKFLLFASIAALLFAGCVETDFTYAEFPTPTPAQELLATPSPSPSLAAEPSPTPSPEASPSPSPSPSLEASPSPSPEPSPSPTPSPSISSGLEMKEAIEEIASDIFNRTITLTARWPANDSFAAFEYSAQFDYRIEFERARKNAWPTDTLLFNVSGADPELNRTKGVFQTINPSKIGAITTTKMECYNWTYYIETYVKQYYYPGQTMREISEALISRIIDICP